jgi:hypothetical protein
MPFKGPRSFNFIVAARTIVALLVGIAAITAAAPYSTIASVSTAEAQQMIEVQAGGEMQQLP